MANTIRIKRSTGNDAPSSLANAELAFAEGTKKLFIGIGTGGDGGSATSIEAIGGSGAFISSTTTRSANAVFAGPSSGSAAAPTFRSLAAADIPTITASKISDFAATVQNVNVGDLVAPAAAFNLNSQKITNLATPTADTDAASKSYVDSVAEGLDVKESVKVATTANITLSGTQTIDGVAVSADERVLVKDQTSGSQNGLYLCKAGTWARTDDLPAGDDAAGMFTFVEQGTDNGDKGFVCTSNKGSAAVGTNSLAYSQFSSSGDVTAGAGLQKVGNVIAIKGITNGGILLNGNGVGLSLSQSAIAGTLGISNGGTGGATAAAARTSLGLAIGTDVEAHSDKLTELATMAQTTADKLADLTNTEVAILDGATVSTDELNILDGVTATSTELNYVDGVTSSIQTQLDAKQGLDAELTELATMASATATALADLTSTEVGILDGATLTTTELNYVDGVTSAIQTQLDNKQPLDAQLTDVAGLAVTDGGFIVGNGSNFVLETGATARSSLGLGSMATQANNNVNIDGGTIDGVTLDGGSYS